MRIAASIALAVAGCAPRAMLVADVRIDGYDVVIEKCPVASSSFWARCQIERQPLPVVGPTSATPRARIDVPVENYRHLGRASDTLTPCAVQHQLHGLLQLTLTIDAGGRVSSVNVDGAPPAFSECAVGSLGSIPFATSAQGTSITFAWQVPDVPPEAP